MTPIAGNVGGIKHGQIANIDVIDETPVPSHKTKRARKRPKNCLNNVFKLCQRFLKITRLACKKNF